MLGADALGLHPLNLYDWPNVTPPANTNIMTTRASQLLSVTAALSVPADITSSGLSLSQVTR